VLGRLGISVIDQRRYDRLRRVQGRPALADLEEVLEGYAA